MTILRAKKPELRKTILNINKNPTQPLKELLQIRGDFTQIKEEFDFYKNIDKCSKLAVKKNCNLIIASEKDFLIVGRIFDCEMLDLVKFKVIEQKGYKEVISNNDNKISINAKDSIKDSINDNIKDNNISIKDNKISIKDNKIINNVKIPPAELFTKYAIFIRNIKNKRIENIFVDLFNQKSNKISLDFQYAWIIEELNETYEIKFVRILKNEDFQEIGPFFKLKIDQSFFSEDLFEKATNLTKEKKQKNVSKTDLKDKIGKVYVDKQELKEIKVKSTIKKNK